MRVDRPFFVPLAITVVTAIIAALLFVSALVSWLAEEPCLLVGAFMAVIAFVVYQVSLKSYFKQISEELGVIYSVSRVIRGWLDWATALIGATNEKEGVD